MTSISSFISSSTASASSVSSGIGGLVSGLDTDSLVKSLSARSQSKIDAQDQRLQKLQWKQDAYRKVISAMSAFKDSYLNVLSSTNIGSASLFNTTKVISSSDAVTVSATASSSAGSFTINSISQLATAETLTSSSKVTANLESTVTATSITSSINSLAGKSISLTLDGKTKAITFDSTFVSNVGTSGLTSALQTSIDTAFGVTGPTDRIITVSTNASDMLNFTATGSTLTIGAIGSDATTLPALGLTNGQSNTLSTSTALGKLSLATVPGSSSGTYAFSVNGVAFLFASTDSLSKMISQINSSKAGVNLSYSNITDKFTLTANNTGAGKNITVADTSGTLMSALGLTATTGTSTAGKNAMLAVNGQQIVRSSNNITVSGVNVGLNKISATPITVSMTADSTALKTPITKLVDDYNKMIDLINTYVKEDSNSGYAPLTAAQKKEMTADEITKWEEKAKAGILKGDTALKSIASKLQQTMYSSADKGGISLLDLGITSAGYNQNGKLKVNEDALTKALSTKAAQITDLFTSSTGLASKLTKIFDDSISTSGVRGSRGTLVEIAGVKDTISSTQNSLYNQITDTTGFIKTLKNKLDDEQSRLWKKFSAMETALSTLNSQGSMLSSFAIKA